MPKRIGRPLKPAPPGTRVPLGLKVTAETKTRLDREAREHGRTQSQQAEVLLESALARQGLITDVLTLAYGRTVGGLLMLAGEAMQRAGGGSAIRKAVREGVGDIERRNMIRGWSDDTEAFDQAISAAMLMLEWLRPADAPEASLEASKATQGSAESLIHDVKNADRIVVPDDRLNEIRRLLGPLIDRPAPDEARRAARLAAAGRGKQEGH